MLDVNQLRKDVDAMAARLRTRGFEFDVATFTALEGERKTVQVETEALQAKRNALSKQIGQLKGKGGDASALMAEVAALVQAARSHGKVPVRLSCAVANGNAHVESHTIVRKIVPEQSRESVRKSRTRYDPGRESGVIGILHAGQSGCAVKADQVQCRQHGIGRGFT